MGEQNYFYPRPTFNITEHPLPKGRSEEPFYFHPTHVLPVEMLCNFLLHGAGEENYDSGFIKGRITENDQEIEFPNPQLYGSIFDQQIFLKMGQYMYRIDEETKILFHLMNNRWNEYHANSILYPQSMTMNILGNYLGRFKWLVNLEGYFGHSVGYFYLIESNGIYKIGITGDIHARFKRYVTESPHESRLIFAVYVRGYEAIEALAHEHFKEKRHRGEWFRLGNDDVGLLLSLVCDLTGMNDRRHHIINFNWLSLIRDHGVEDKGYRHQNERMDWTW